MIPYLRVRSGVFNRVIGSAQRSRSMSDPVSRYHDGFTRLEKADQLLKSLLTMLATVSEAIRSRPADLVFMNGQPTTARQATTPLAKSIDAREWPDAARLQSLFDEWRTARDEL